MNDRFSLSIAALTADDTARLLQEQGIASDTVRKIRFVVHTLETAVYAGKSLKDSDVVKELLGLVKALEKGIR